MKKITALAICLAICVTAILSPGAALAERSLEETEGQKQVREAGQSVEWIDFGASFDFATSFSFYPKDDEGFFGVGAFSVEHTDSGDVATQKYVFIDSAGKQAIPDIYLYAEPFHDGLAHVTTMDWKGPKLIDNTGKTVLDLGEYSNILDYDEGLVVVTGKTDFKRGVVDITGAEIIPCEHDFLFIRDGLLLAADGTGDGFSYSLFDRTGKAITDTAYDEFPGSGTLGADEWIAAGRDGKYGFLDKSGHVVIPFEYDETGVCGESVYALKENGKWCLIDNNGDAISSVEFDMVGQFSECLALAGISGKYGFINTSGEIVIPFEYDEVRDFSEGGAEAVKIVDGARLYYVIGKTGEILIGPKEYATEWKGAYIGHFDEFAGTDIVPPHNYTIREALLDSAGSRLTEFSYRYIGEFSDGLAVAEVYNTNYYSYTTGVINQYGAVVVPMMFQQIELIDKHTCLVLAADGVALQSGGNEISRVGILRLPDDAATHRPDADVPITVHLGGLELYFDSEPLIIGGRTMVPMRKIFESLNAEVLWESDLNRVTATKGDLTFALTIGNTAASINGETVSLDIPAEIRDGRTLVPLRFVSEALDCGVLWLADTRQVIITSPLSS